MLHSRLNFQDPRFGEILSVAEGLDQDALKKAIRKSRVLYNRGGADEPEVTDKGELSRMTHSALSRCLTLLSLPKNASSLSPPTTPTPTVITMFIP